MTTPSIRTLARRYFDDVPAFVYQGQLCRYVNLTKGHFAIVDAADYEWLTQWKWSAASDGRGRFYAVRGFNIGNKKTRIVKMHREILGLKFGDKTECDHRETEETLNNTRANLRVATHQQNRCNIGKYRTNTSGFKGVTRAGNRWLAQMSLNGEKVKLGTRPTREEAAELYAEAVQRQHGEFARTA